MLNGSGLLNLFTILKLTILGCHSATPRDNARPTAQILEMRGHILLIDCGEGTQIQLRKNKIIQSGKNWLNFLFRIAIANFSMFLCLSFFEQPLSWWISLELLHRSFWLLLAIVTSMLVYFSALFLSGIKLDILKFKSD